MDKISEDIDDIRQLQQGKKDALYKLYARYSGALYGVIIRMCKEETLAQEILQDTFVKVWRQIHTYDPERGRFYTWAYRIARNTTLNALRKQKKLIQTEDLGVYINKEEENKGPDYTQLNGVLRNLEPHHQTAIELVYFKGLTHREAHQEMDVPLGTFKSYVQQALKHLRTAYQKEGLVLLFFIKLWFGNG
ncbi:MAG: sigma-70 family RNA polymerase sigma factor [Eudoraea sp.]|nr:sigma-70 family RNA polymerase sigma factor [Eudoraea sp.]MBT8223474.1 sigma-70 family RNA polymerase sigma factor [Eudoraea sp.]NNJ39625.1 sigma-70 family RNA polymerase sigma factor [Eudoraea sp.]